MEILGTKYYTLPEVAKMLGVTLRTAYTWRDSGKIECVKRGGRYLVAEEAIKSLLK